MTKEELKARLTELMPTAAFDETGEWLDVLIGANEWRTMAEGLRNLPELDFDYMFSVAGVDWKTHLAMVYHLESKKHKQVVVIKAKIADRNNAAIETVSDIWRTAELNEREAFDLFGIKFLNHPDLRRLFLTDDWEGWPLRKDYVDEVNIIKL